MRFSDYMQAWLYGEQGYYTQAPQIGQRGDFVTSVAVSPFFGGTLARHLLERIKSGALSRHCTLCEIGAHRGHLLADMVQFIYTLDPELLKTLKLVIVEPIAALRALQRDYFEASFGSVAKLHQVDSLDQLQCSEGFVVANELFDAFSVDLIRGDQWAVVEDHSITWEEAPEAVLRRARTLGIERGELAVGFERFAEAIAAAFDRCELITFDYGQPQARNDFSIRIYREQKVWPLFEPESLEPFFARSDLTADVHFGHLCAAFQAAGFRADGIQAQNVALLEMGLGSLLETLQQKAGYEAYRQEVGRVRALLDPAMLGERFKRARFLKGVD